MGVRQNISGLKRDGRALAIVLKVLTRRLLRRGARYGRKLEHKWPRPLRPRSLCAGFWAGERIMVKCSRNFF